jgi:hypothetical protein
MTHTKAELISAKYYRGSGTEPIMETQDLKREEISFKVILPKSHVGSKVDTRRIIKKAN